MALAPFAVVKPTSSGVPPLLSFREASNAGEVRDAGNGGGVAEDRHNTDVDPNEIM